MAKASTITVHVPRLLRSGCAGAATLALVASDVRGALEELERQYPEVHRGVCDETGQLRRHINLFVNSAHMRDREGLDTGLEPGDDIIIVPAVSGG
jgi:molybdopterin synthase sulfur carrier subunit